MADTTLVDTLICAAAQAWKDDGEVLATGIGLVPRLAASLAKLTVNPDLMMTDSEAFLVEEPIPVGPRGDVVPRYSGHMSFERVFDCVWRGLRHAIAHPQPRQAVGLGKRARHDQVGVRAHPRHAVVALRGREVFGVRLIKQHGDWVEAPTA